MKTIRLTYDKDTVVYVMINEMIAWVKSPEDTHTRIEMKEGLTVMVDQNPEEIAQIVRRFS